MGLEEYKSNKIVLFINFIFRNVGNLFFRNRSFIVGLLWRRLKMMIIGMNVNVKDSVLIDRVHSQVNDQCLVAFLFFFKFLIGLRNNIAKLKAIIP